MKKERNNQTKEGLVYLNWICWGIIIPDQIVLNQSQNAQVEPNVIWKQWGNDSSVIFRILGID